MTDSSSPSRLRTAIAGIGGFATAHHSALLELEEENRVQVVATCDPFASKLQTVCEEKRLAERGVCIYEDFDAMLAEWSDKLDLVTVAAPIPVHAAMHAACVKRGIPCYMEKPPTLNPEELESMIECDKEARIPTEVGFNFIYQPFRHELKARILAGEFGALKRVSFHGLWPRSLRYFGRNSWAGRLFTDNGTITLDSCCGNAMAHHVHNILFFGGTDGLASWGTPVELEAELYRANDIQGTDTVFCRARLESGVELRIAATHACVNEVESREVLECEEATLEILPLQACWRLIRKDGTTETFPTTPATLLDNLRLYTQLIAGELPRPSTLLSDCRGFVRLNALLYLAAQRITNIPASHNSGIMSEEDTYRTIQDIRAITTRALETGEFPSEQGVTWAVAGGKASVENLSELRDCLTAISASV